MSKRTTKKYLFAFSLVELMAAISIVSILVSIALPRFRAFIARSRMAEATANLGILATLAQSYKIEYSTTAPVVNMGKGNCNPNNLNNALGFRVVDCTTLRYSYYGSSFPTANSSDSEIYPGCSGATYPNQDMWSINEQRHLQHVRSALTVCSN